MTLNQSAPPSRLHTKDGLSLALTTSGDSDVFAQFFAGYDKAFVLPNEKEDEEGFRLCFDLNEGAARERLTGLYGPYREVCFVARDEKLNLAIGGANFLAMPIDAETISANLNYIYINAEARGGGHFSRLYQAVREAVAACFPERKAARVLIFIEQNDPFRMTAEDYRRDTDFTGLDQFDRLRIWAKRGARIVDFAYAQPPLSSDQEVDDTLVYSVLGAEGASISACVLEGHLRRFFGVSVLKGAPLDANEAAWRQIDGLRKACANGETIALLDPAPLLNKIHRRDDADAAWPKLPETFRAALRAL